MDPKLYFSGKNYSLDKPLYCCSFVFFSNFMDCFFDNCSRCDSKSYQDETIDKK